jgi:hypothetical protein
MERYGDFRPTQFDPKGLGLEDQQDWLVLGVSKTRDSGPLAQSNFDAALKILDPEEDSEDVDTASFNHWGPGWFEIILVKPGTKAHEKAKEIEACLADYPVLDDEDHSRREWEEHSEWVGQVLARVAHDNEGEVSDNVEHPALCQSLGWDYGGSTPSDEDVYDALVEHGWFIPDEPEAQSLKDAVRLGYMDRHAAEALRKVVAITMDSLAGNPPLKGGEDE